MELIGVRANIDCPSKYTKVLEKGKTYHFTQWFKVNDGDDSITEKRNPLSDLYDLENTSIQISAIAGKNGSGKSTILDLIYLILNNLSYLEPSLQHPLTFVEDLSACLFFKTDQIYKINAQDGKVKIYKYADDHRILKRPTTLDFREFFYSLVINYSQYAFNSKESASWLNGLFHKNDGYQIPIVLNPMRSNGNIDINTENQLSKARFLTNLLRPGVKDHKISENLEAKSVKLTIDTKNRNTQILYILESENKNGNRNPPLREKVRLIDLVIDRALVLKKLNEIYYFKLFSLIDEDQLEMQNSDNTIIDEFLKISLDYIFYKLVSIALTYPEYGKFFDKENKKFYPEEISHYLEDLILKDTSHKAFKIKQTLNFLKYQHIPFKNQRIDLVKLSKTIENVIVENHLDEERRIELIPPPVFKTSISLGNVDVDYNELISFDTLSSGEKQLIYSTNSIIYHLENLDSVNRGHQYKNVNIFMDEIELYFHPEYQRQYIKYLLDQVSYSKFRRIKNLNFCFITHSPFILSDIPTANILFLNVNKYHKAVQCKIGSETFCANIHELLADGFFMNNGLMGAYAIGKVKEIIKILEDPNEIDIGHRNKQKILYFIESIGEVLLKEKLLELFEEKYLKENIEEENIEEEIARLEKELNEAKMRKKGFDKN